MTKELFMSGRRLRVGFMMLVCTVLLSFGVFSGDVFAKVTPQELVITGVEGGWRIDARRECFVIEKPGDYTIKMKQGYEKTNQFINVKTSGGITSGVYNLTLENVNIESVSEYGAISIEKGTLPVNIILKGENHFTKTGMNSIAGIITNDTPINITGEYLEILDNDKNPIRSNEGTDINIGGGAKLDIATEHEGMLIIDSEENPGNINISGGARININSGGYGALCTQHGKLNISGGASVFLTVREMSTGMFIGDDVTITEGSKVSIDLGGDNCAMVCDKGNVTIDDGAVVTMTAPSIAQSVVRLFGENAVMTIDGGKAVFNGFFEANYFTNKIKFGENKHINYLGDSKAGKAVATDTAVQAASGKKYLEIVSVYPITYNYNGGTPANGNPGEYTVDDEFTISNPIKDGAEFAGWTGTGLTAPTKVVKIPKGSYGPRSYTATWKEAVPEPKPTPEPTPEPKPEPTDELKVTLKKTSSTYNGKTPKIEVKSISFAGKKVSLKAKDYKITYSPKTVKNAGEYTVTLTVKNGKYKGKTGTATYTIKKAANPLTVKRLKKTITVKASEIKSKAKTYKIKKAAKISKQQGKITYEALPGTSDKVIFNTNNGSITVPKGLAKGKYTVKFRVTAAGGTNYKAKSVTITQTIQVKAK